jgi:IS4 transposase
MVMIFAQIAGKTSIRDIMNSLESRARNLYHMGIGKISRNNLAHHNGRRDHRIFEETYYMMKNRLLNTFNPSNEKKFKFKQHLKSIDSTTLSLCKSLYEWAEFRKTKSGVKMHTVLNHESHVPDFIAITNAKCNDAKGLNRIPIQGNSIYVMDRAYLSLKWLYSLVLAGSHFVIRLKSNTKYAMVKRNRVSKHNRKKGIILDHEIKFTGTKKDDYPATLRRVKYRDHESGEVYNYITDNFHLSPFTIAEIYRDRWSIELFFKKIKQNLKIKHFLGRSENAVRIQIWIAMIVVLLYEWNKHLSSVDMGFREFLSRIQPNLFSKRNMDEILNYDKYKGDLNINSTGTKQEWSLF